MTTDLHSTAYSVAYDDYGNWSFYPDGNVPDDWTIWASGLTWEQAHDALHASTKPTVKS